MLSLRRPDPSHSLRWCCGAPPPQAVSAGGLVRLGWLGKGPHCSLPAPAWPGFAERREGEGTRRSWWAGWRQSALQTRPAPAHARCMCAHMQRTYAHRTHTHCMYAHCAHAHVPCTYVHHTRAMHMRKRTACMHARIRAHVTYMHTGPGSSRAAATAAGPAEGDKGPAGARWLAGRDKKHRDPGSWLGGAPVLAPELM